MHRFLYSFKVRNWSGLHKNIYMGLQPARIAVFNTVAKFCLTEIRVTDYNIETKNSIIEMLHQWRNSVLDENSNMNTNKQNPLFSSDKKNYERVFD